jgi:uncharacterized RDD family membrane protein YckC
MNKKLSIGIIVALVIAAAFVLGPFCLPVWIYLVWMVRKKKISLFHDEMELKLAERLYKMLKAFLIVAGISLAVLIVLLVGVVIYNAVYGMNEIAEAVAHYIGFSSLGVFNIATYGGLVIFFKGRRKTT